MNDLHSCIYVCMYVYAMCVCMYVCMICMYVCMSVCMYVCMIYIQTDHTNRSYMHTYVHTFTFILMTCIHVRTREWHKVIKMHIRLYVMLTSMYVHIFTYICTRYHEHSIVNPHLCCAFGSQRTCLRCRSTILCGYQNSRHSIRIYVDLGTSRDRNLCWHVLD